MVKNTNGIIGGKMKRALFLSAVLSVFLFIVVIPVKAAPSVVLNGKNLAFDVAPTIENGRTLVPLRAIFEAMGATVSWDQNTQTVTAIKGNTNVVLKIGSLEPTINGQTNKLDVPGKIINNRVLVPLRFVGEAFGGNVSWDETTQTININGNKGQNVTAYKLILNFSFGTREGEYTGSLVNGLPNGKGVFKSKNTSGTGWSYSGEFVNGHFSGSGSTIWENGLKGEGIYANDYLTKGTFYNTDGTIQYTGEWKDDNYSGIGKLFKNGKVIYEGTFKDGLPEESSFKSKCVNIEYDDLARNPDKNIGQSLKISGTVIQVIEGENDKVDYRIEINDNYKTILYATYYHKKDESRVLQDDNIEIWGFYNGLHTYTSIMKVNITVPYVDAQYISIQGTSSNKKQVITSLPSNDDGNNSYLEQRKAQCLEELNQLAAKLENVKNEKNTRIFQNGRWEYIADPQKVAAAQKAYDQKYAEYQSLLNQ